VWSSVPDWILDLGFRGRVCFFLAAGLRVGVSTRLDFGYGHQGCRGCVRAGWIASSRSAGLRVGVHTRLDSGSWISRPSLLLRGRATTCGCTRLDLDRGFSRLCTDRFGIFPVLGLLLHDRATSCGWEPAP